MYKRDNKEIELHAAESPEGFLDVVEFVLCSIQASLQSTKIQRQDIEANGFNSRFLWGTKRAGLKHAVIHKEVLWSKLQYLRDVSKYSPEVITEAIEIILAIPGLGLVNAAFVAQLLGFDVACLDSHNLKRLGKGPAFVALNKKLKPKTKRAKILAYVKFTQEKGSEYWWDSWCEHVAGNRGNSDLATADLVSRWHVRVIKLFT